MNTRAKNVCRGILSVQEKYIYYLFTTVQDLQHGRVWSHSIHVSQRIFWTLQLNPLKHTQRH